MYPVSDRFLPRLAESHTPVTQVLLFTTDGRVLDLEHTGGSVSVDRGQDIRRTCTVTGCDTSLIPRTPADELATYGARLQVLRGVDYADGSIEVVPLGMFRLDDVDGDPALGPVTLQGKAIEVIIQADLFLTPYRATGTVIGAITALIQRSIPDAGIVATMADVVIGARTWDVGDDPWAAVQEIAAVAGAECYTDGSGTFVIGVLPDLASTMPAWEVAAKEGGVYVTGTRAMSSANVYNGVYARSDNTESGAVPVHYLATDSDTGSPTYWNGPFGRRPAPIYSSSALTTTSACQAAAQLQLVLAKAPNAKGDFSTLPNPALEVGDVLRVIHPDGTRELHQAASFTIPLETGGDFPITTISAKEDS